nr:DUF4262 domain-containing protein [Mucilaginibacter sp. L294]
MDESLNDNPDYDKITTENVDKYGCHLVLIEAGNYLPAFVYSIGLYKNFGHPEIICFGLKTEVMAGIINHARDMIKAGETFLPDKAYRGFLEGYDIQFVEVDKEFYANYLGYAGWFYNSTFDFPALQLVWPDKESNFPWEDSFNPDWKFKQPLLDRNVDFKFYESKDLGVYTTQQALDGTPVLYVYHNEDGDWQFHTSLEPDISDGKLVCLKHLVEVDPSLNSIYHLQYGWAASRTDRDSEWELEEYPDEEESIDQPNSINKPTSGIKKVINWFKGS